MRRMRTFIRFSVNVSDALNIAFNASFVNDSYWKRKAIMKI